jgi:hypothetical protein
MSEPSYYILQGGPENIDFFENNAAYRDEDWWWSGPKTAKPGDLAFIYLTAPLSRIVGRVKIIGEPFYNAAHIFNNPIMNDRWCVPVGDVLHYPARRELTMRGLRELFSVDWAWVRYPRGNTRIPDHIIKPFLELVDGDRESAAA